MGYEYPEFQGQQFILEKGDYPRYEAWSGNSSYRTEHMLSFRPIKCAVSYHILPFIPFFLFSLCWKCLTSLFLHLSLCRTTVTARWLCTSVRTSRAVSLRCAMTTPPYRPWAGAARRCPLSKSTLERKWYTSSFFIAVILKVLQQQIANTTTRNAKNYYCHVDLLN